jgi:CheY-like chemotaxis protein
VSVSLLSGQSARSASILVVDDEPDVAELFRQRFRRETRQGTYVLHYAALGTEALDRLSEAIEPPLIAVLSNINMPSMDGLTLLSEIKQRIPDPPWRTAPTEKPVHQEGSAIGSAIYSEAPAGGCGDFSTE